jgi:hypothetical protein
MHSKLAILVRDAPRESKVELPIFDRNAAQVRRAQFRRDQLREK